MQSLIPILIVVIVALFDIIFSTHMFPLRKNGIILFIQPSSFTFCTFMFVIKVDVSNSFVSMSHVRYVIFNAISLLVIRTGFLYDTIYTL